MKKLIVLMLAAVMLLCGCSAEEGSMDGDQKPETEGSGIGEVSSNIADNTGEALEKEEESLLELGQGERQDSLMVLKITVNPAFELYVDMNGCVSRVRCLNEDAATAFQSMTDNGIDVIGQDYPNAMMVILENLSTTGFLTAETEQIQIETTVYIEMPEEDLTSLAATLVEPVEEYSAKNDLTLTVENPAPKVDAEAAEALVYNIKKGEPNSKIESATSYYGISGTQTLHYDGNGCLYLLADEYADGSSQTIEYAANGTMVHHQLINADGSSREEFYDESGIKTKDTQTDVGGTRFEFTYYPNGNYASSLVSHAGGGYVEKSYNEAGGRVSQISVGADGSREELIWYLNGHLKTSITDGADGYYESHYFEDGSMSRYVEKSNRGYCETVYYPSGTVASKIDGYGERRYDESGHLTYQKYESAETSYLFENGALVYYITDGREVTNPNELANIAVALGLG